MTTSLKFLDWILSKERGSVADGITFVGLDGLSKAMAIASSVLREERPWFAVTRSRNEAHFLIEHLQFFLGSSIRSRIHYIPEPEFDYYRGLLPNPELIAERNVGLFHALNDPKGRIFVSSVGALLHKAFPPTEYLRATRVIAPNDEIDRESFIHQLLEAGYQRQPNAMDPGVFAVRGGVMDIFCPLYDNPVRIEFFGDLIDEIRFFEPRNQRSLEKIDKFFVLPVGSSLVPRGADLLPAIENAKERLDQIGVPKAKRDEVIERVRDGVYTTDMSLLFPLLSKGSSSLFDFFPDDTQIFLDGREDLRAQAIDLDLSRLKKSHELYLKDSVPIADFNALFVDEAEITKKIDASESVSFEAFSKDSVREISGYSDVINLAVERDEVKKKAAVNPLLHGYVERFKDWLDLGYRVHVVCHTLTHCERIKALFEPYGVTGEILPEGQPAFPFVFSSEAHRIFLWQGFLAESRIFPDARVVLLSEEEIFGKKKRASKSASWGQGTDVQKLLSGFRDLKTNDFVVHKEQGIGKYLGLRKMSFQGCDNDFVILEYKDGDKLYIPVYRLNVLQKYVGSEGASPVLDKLGGDRWVKAKGKAQRAVAELAAMLLEIQARRKMIPAFKYSEPGQDYHQFEMAFPFDETPDQMKAIDEVNHDLGHPHPMDRLVCGDVGYGKTEVAMRATYRAVLDGKQVAVLVPTTVLAFQHFETFKKRFSDTGARIEMICRLRSSAEIKETIQKLKDGKIDVVIGTHRLLSTDVTFKDLGLVVVDEEHRFGVIHKERLRKLCETVHMLAMTATPIPRTLNMAMTGLKEISIITTPPPDRLSVRTFVCRSSPDVIVEAISNELAREGQVFFVHNRIETIFKLADELRSLLPRAKIEVAHGQMDPDTLEEKMLNFYRGDAHVLLSTTIIESGLDIPRANTIIIDEAHYFGLAQLYQLRGRVGRSDKRAFCYLLIPPENLLSSDAKQRLQVIQRYSDLGSGFNVASHDLEIRGAGDLLGKDQSGHLNAVGIDLYFELLEECIRDLQGQEKRIDVEPEINLRVPASFPEEYLPDISERILLYRRLSGAETEEAIAEIETEIRDRFGAPPSEVQNLLGLNRLKLFLKKLHVVRMSCGPKKTSLQFAPTTPASPEKLVKLVQKKPNLFSITPDQKLVVAVGETDWRTQLTQIQLIATELGVEA